MILEKIPEIQNLTTNEKSILLEELAIDISKNEESDVRHDYLEILNQRHQDYLKDPTKTSTWNQLKHKVGK